jgi:hypothetical protein
VIDQDRKGGRVKRSLVALALVVSTASCGLPGGRGADPFARADERSLLIRVQNLNLDDMNVTAVTAGQRYPLGLVNGRSTRHFSIPWSSFEDVRFQIDPVTGRRHTTPGLTVGPGENIELVIQRNVQRSFVRR